MDTITHPAMTFEDAISTAGSALYGKQREAEDEAFIAVGRKDKAGYEDATARARKAEQAGELLVLLGTALHCNPGLIAPFEEFRKAAEANKN